MVGVLGDIEDTRVVDMAKLGYFGIREVCFSSVRWGSGQHWAG